jgi:UDP-glucose 4-epimerase
VRILVTGGAGFIGSHVAEAYVAAGHDVLVVDSLVTGRRENVPPGARLAEVDILTPEFEDAFAAFRPEVVNHHAAQASVAISMRDPATDLAVNGGGTARVVSLCLAHRVRKLIHASTGGALYGEPETLPVTEAHPIKPLSNYGLSKRVAELYIDLQVRTAGLCATILRYSNAYGPRQDPRGEAGVIAIFTGRLLNGEPCTIDGDGDQAKDYIHVADITRANVAALDRGDGLAINIGTGHGVTVNEIHNQLAAAIGDAPPAQHGPPRPGDVRRIWLDASLARSELAWEPSMGFEEGIRQTVAWYRGA